MAKPGYDFQAPWVPQCKRSCCQGWHSHCSWSSSFRKSLSNPLDSAQAKDCVYPACAPMELLQLNASTLSDPNSLCIPLTSPHISNNSVPLMRFHNPYPRKSTSYWLFPSNGTWSVTIPMTSTPTQCPPYISLKTPLHICHPLQLRDKVSVQGLYYSKPHYYSKLSKHQVFYCTVHIISLDFHLY